MRRTLRTVLTTAVLVVASAGTAAAQTGAGGASATSGRTTTAAPAPVEPVGVPAVLDVRRYDPAARLVRDAEVQVGVQVYDCTTAPGAAPRWVLRGPQALLGTPLPQIHHSFGPRWQLLSDGSAVIGTVSQQAPSAMPGAIAQLLLTARPAPAAPVGQLTGVAWVQRLDTRGGTPVGTCDSASVGAVTVSPYSAHYYFWAA